VVHFDFPAFWFVLFTLEALRTGLYLYLLLEELLSIAGIGEISLNDTADKDADVLEALASHSVYFLLEFSQS
jgi:hypothetical protein